VTRVDVVVRVEVVVPVRGEVVVPLRVELVVPVRVELVIPVRVDVVVPVRVELLVPVRVEPVVPVRVELVVPVRADELVVDRPAVDDGALFEEGAALCGVSDLLGRVAFLSGSLFSFCAQASTGSNNRTTNVFPRTFFVKRAKLIATSLLISNAIRGTD